MWRKALSIALGFAYTNIYFSIGAAIACFGTQLALGLPALSMWYYILLGTATVITYCWHWWLTPYSSTLLGKEQWSYKHRPLLLGLLIGAAIISIYSAVQLPLKYLYYFVPLVIVAILYTLPKLNNKLSIQLRGKVIAKTIYLALALLYALDVMPLLLSEQAWEARFTTYLWYRFYLLLSICLIFDYKDRLQDAQGGIKTLLPLIGLPLAHFIVQLLLSCGIVCLLNLSTLLPVSTLLILATPLLALIPTHKRILISNHPAWYYLFADGLIFASGLIMLIIY
jgi:hypothetical protein